MNRESVDNFMLHMQHKLVRWGHCAPGEGVEAFHEPGSRGRESAHSEAQSSQRRLTSAATVQQFKARTIRSGVLSWAGTMQSENWLALTLALSPGERALPSATLGRITGW